MKLELNKVYRARNGKQFKIFCIVEGDSGQNTYVATNKSQCELFRFHEDCHCKDYYGGDYDLIELVGDDFTERTTGLREFKFVGYLPENDESGYFEPHFAIDNALGKNVGFLYSECGFFHTDAIISKWEITMKELPMEKKHND